MLKRKSWRVPLGFLIGGWFLLTAEPTPVSMLVGMVLMTAGEAIRLISAGTLVKNREVTREGIYAYTRNPLYTGSFLLGIGACVMGHDLIFAVIFLTGYITLYYSTIRREERYLAVKHGEAYASYLAEVPRLIPHRITLGAVLRKSSLKRALANKEGRTVLGIIAIILIMTLKLRYSL